MDHLGAQRWGEEVDNDGDAELMKRPVSLPSLAILILLAVGISSACAPRPPVVSQPETDDIQCEETVPGGCLDWRAYDYSFTPDSRFLLISYYYVAAGTKLTPAVAVKIDLIDLSLEPFEPPACENDLYSPQMSPDGKRVVFVVRSPIKTQSGDKENKAKRHLLRIGVKNSRSKKVFLVPNYWGEYPRSKFFSRDGQQVFFLTTDITKPIIRTFDFGSNLYADFYSRQPISGDPRSSGVKLPFHGVRNISFDKKEQVLRFAAVTFSETDWLLDPMRDAAKRAKNNVRIMSFVYGYRLKDKSYYFHEINEVLRKDIERGFTSLGFGRVQWMRNGDAYFKKELSFTSPEPDRIYHYRDGVATPFVSIEQPVQNRVTTRASAFAVSENRRWVAYTYQAMTGVTTGVDVTVILDRETDTTRVLDLREKRFRELMFGAMCVAPR